MYRTWHKALSKYCDIPLLRALLKAAPFGEQVDFYITESNKAATTTRTDRWNAEPYVSRIAALQTKVAKNPRFNRELLVKRVPKVSGIDLRPGGHAALTKEQEKSARQFSIGLARNNFPNDPCAVLSSEPAWSDDPLCLYYKTALYSEVQALRQFNELARLISANAVLYCEEVRQVLIHRRSPQSADFSNTLHTFGGAFMPPNVDSRGDINGLRECLRREVAEETGISITVPHSTPFAVIDEIALNFVQISYLGINISSQQLEDMRPNWEGTIVKIPFDELLARLQRVEEWTPSGWLDIVLWLALDAPNSSGRIKFNKKNCSQVFEEALTYI